LSEIKCSVCRTSLHYINEPCPNCLPGIAERPYGQAASTDDISRLQQDLLLCRRQIWLSHGCPIASLYGDDGEMQCASGRHKPLDFKRQPIAEILEELQRANLAAYNK